MVFALDGPGCVQASTPAGGLRVGRVVVQRGSPDVNLFAAVGPAVPGRCDGAVDLNSWTLVLDAQVAGLDWRLPAQRAIPLPAEARLWLLSTRGATRVDLEPAAEPSPVDVHALWSGQRDFVIPPSSNGVAVDGNCTLGASDMRVVAMLGDVRAHARSFSVSRYDGEHIDEIYRGVEFATFDPPLVVPAHGGLHYLCIYDNADAVPVRFGPDPRRDEHCNLFVYYEGQLTQCLEQTGGW
jgi:hypothetical protein